MRWILEAVPGHAYTPDVMRLLEPSNCRIALSLTLPTGATGTDEHGPVDVPACPKAQLRLVTSPGGRRNRARQLTLRGPKMPRCVCIVGQATLERVIHLTPDGHEFPPSANVGPVVLDVSSGLVLVQIPDTFRRSVRYLTLLNTPNIRGEFPALRHLDYAWSTSGGTPACGARFSAPGLESLTLRHVRMNAASLGFLLGGTPSKTLQSLTLVRADFAAPLPPSVTTVRLESASTLRAEFVGAAKVTTLECCYSNGTFEYVQKFPWLRKLVYRTRANSDGIQDAQSILFGISESWRDLDDLTVTLASPVYLTIRWTRTSGAFTITPRHSKVPILETPELTAVWAMILSRAA